MQYRFIAIEGNIGVGKSTLATMLSEYYNSRLILEEFEDNTFLPKFYNEPERYAFPLELSFFADRYKQMKQLLLQKDLFSDSVISDFLFIKSKLFARINLNADEYVLFDKLYEIAEANLPQPDLLLFLKSPVPQLQNNIKRRGRVYEQQISDMYLEKVESIYGEYLKLNSQKTIFIDMEKVDFSANPQQFQQLISFLEKDIDFQTFHLDIQ